MVIVFSSLIVFTYKFNRIISFLTKTDKCYNIEKYENTYKKEMRT